MPSLPLPEPTTAPPGSPEKVAVLAERVRLGQQLWHPDDARAGAALRARGTAGHAGHAALASDRASPPGVSWSRGKKRWRVRQPLGERRHVGYYPTLEEALDAHRRLGAVPPRAA